MGLTCAAVGCSNSISTLKKLKEQQCDIHSTTRKDCMCGLFLVNSKCTKHSSEFEQSLWSNINIYIIYLVFNT